MPKYYEQPKDGGDLKDAMGRVYTMDDWQRSGRKAIDHPESLTDEDLAIIESFDSTKQADRAAERRRRAQAPPTPPQPSSQPRDSSPPRAEAPAVILRYPRDLAVEYDTEAFARAMRKYYIDARSMTDGDIAQLAVIDEELAGRAHARRAGHEEVFTQAQLKEFSEPVLEGSFALWKRDYLGPMLGTYRYRLKQLRDGLDALATKVSALDGPRPSRGGGSAAALPQEFVEGSIGRDGSYSVPPPDLVTKQAATIAVLERQLADVIRRLVDVERTPRGLLYAGVWQRAATYSRHEGVTHKGSLWVCVADGSRGSEPGSGPTAKDWQMACRAGADGKDAK